ncbi:hypothetical protein BCEP27_30786 [Burkholderia cepacia]
MLIATNLRPRSVESGWIPTISTRDSLPDWLRNPAAGQGWNRFLLCARGGFRFAVSCRVAGFRPGAAGLGSSGNR